MSIHRLSNEVFVGEGGIVKVRADDIEFLSSQARMNPRRRARLCAHPDSRDRLHEMLIVLACGTYIRPHRHAGKSESFHIIEGDLEVVVFHDDGRIREIVPMGPYGSGKAFYYRLMEPSYHTVLINSPFALFHETTNGPFDRADTEFAPWSPAEDEGGAVEYMEGLCSQVHEPIRRAA